MTNGVFDAVLGSSNPLDLDFDEKYYLGIAVGLDPELGRVELTAAPYSLNARTVEDGAVTAAKLADHAVTGGEIEDETDVRSLNGLRADGCANRLIADSERAVRKMTLAR